MDTSSNADATSTNPSAQAGTQVTEALSAADGVATDGIQALQQVHQARLAQANRALATLKAQYGADDPRVQTAQAAVQAGQTTISRVSLLRQQMATPSVQVAKTGWVLQGRVLNADLQPAARFTVFLVDAKKAFLQQYGFAYTDDAGYFELDYAGPGSKAETGAAQLFVEVANTDANPVYLSPTPFVPAAGAASFLNIVLPADGQPIGDPPPEIRNIALPKNPKPKKEAKPDSKKS